MKILGKSTSGKYICEVSHTEIEKFLNKYYNKMERLDAGDSVDLGKGYDFYRLTKECMEATTRFLGQHQKIVSMITTGISMFPEAEKGE